MRLMLLASLFLVGCTFRVETRTEKEIERDESIARSERVLKRCIERCAPYKAITFDPIDWRCGCEVPK
jgi:hypothetical protein